MKQKGNLLPISISTVEQKILLVRDEKVILDSDLAELYGVEIRSLTQAVKRNIERFPKDFMFQLSREEAISLRSQIVTLETGRGRHRKYLPYVFTEHGALMVANILKSKRAVQVSIQIIRTFILMRQTLAANKDLARKLGDLEKRYDKQFSAVFAAVKALMNPPRPKLIKPKKIGFNTK